MDSTKKIERTKERLREPEGLSTEFIQQRENRHKLTEHQGLVGL